MTYYQLPSDAKAGAIYLAKFLDTTKDITVSFDYACYGTDVSGSEGFSLFFYNSYAKFLSGGGPGPGLCYAPIYGISAVIDNQLEDFFYGVRYGQLGVGFDLTGGFSTSAYGISGLGEGKPNTITIRGSQNQFYNRLFTSQTLNSSAFSQPLSLYQQVTARSDIKFNTMRVRLTDFCKKIIIDHKKAGNSGFINYVSQALPESWPISVNCCLGFSSGLQNTCFAVKNFNVNGFFISTSTLLSTFTSSATAITGGDIFQWIYYTPPYLGASANPFILNIDSGITIQNAPPWDIDIAPLILVNPTGEGPLQNTDGYITIQNI